VATAQLLLALFRADEGRLTGLGRSGPSVRQGYAALRRRPLTSTKQLKELSGLSFPIAGKALETLVELGIAREITGGQRNRLFAYDAYLAILSEGAEPLCASIPPLHGAVPRRATTTYGPITKPCRGETCRSSSPLPDRPWGLPPCRRGG